MAELKKDNKEIPSHKIISPEIPGPGFAVFQQGKHVVHRATGLTSPGERTPASSASSRSSRRKSPFVSPGP